LPILEDACLMRSLKSEGSIITAKERVLTSARRFERLGPGRTWIINQLVLLSFLRGTDPEEIAYLYRSRQGLGAWIRLLMKTIMGKDPAADTGRNVHETP